MAIKVLPTELDAPGRDRRQTEARLLASMNHPALVTLYDAVATEDATYLVMELMEGGTLGRLVRAGAMDPAVVAGVGEDIAGALAHIHARGIVHRDVKPANILLTGEVGPLGAKLSDFGIAKLLETAPSRTSGVLGTAQYLSPEQARGESVGPPSDVYSLGLTLIEASTGVPAFPGTALESLTARLLRDPEVPGDLGYDWRSLLSAMTARDPAARPLAHEVAQRARNLAGRTGVGVMAALGPETAPLRLGTDVGADVVTATSPLPAGEVTTALPVAPERRRRAPVAAIVVAVAVAAVLALVTVLSLTTGSAGPDRSPSSIADPSRSASSGAPASATPAPVATRSTSASSTPSTAAPASTSTAASTTAGNESGTAASTGKGAASGKGKGSGKEKKEKASQKDPGSGKGRSGGKGKG